MIAEEVQRRIWIIGLTLTVILGGLFLIWAIFLNRGTILIHAKSPYAISIAGLRTDNCTTDDCTSIVAPGDYNITIQKTGYKSVTKNITVPLGQPYEDTINLEFIPVITPINQTADQIFGQLPQLSNQQFEKLGIPSSTQVFFDTQGKIVCYIVRDPGNFRQTLYQATVDASGNISQPQLVTSFLRDLQNYTIIPADSGDKVAIIDQASDQSTLYMVDEKGQNRASLFNDPVIRSMRFIPGTNDFLFVARDVSEAPESLFIYRSDEARAIKLNLQTPLDDVAILTKDRIIAITNQALPPVQDQTTLYGQLVPLGDNQSTAEVSALTPGTTVTPQYSFIDYSLIANNARLITTINQDPFPNRIKASDDQKSVYYLQGDKVYQLQFDQ